MISPLKSVEGHGSGLSGAVQLQVAGKEELPVLPGSPAGRMAPASSPRFQALSSRPGRQVTVDPSSRGIRPGVVQGNAGLVQDAARIGIIDRKRIGGSKDVLIPGAEIKTGAQILI